MTWLEGNRKLLIFLICMIGIIAALLMKVVTVEQFKEMFLWLVGLYTGGNVGEHVAKAIGKKNGTSG